MKLMLLEGGIIEPTNFSWHPKVLAVADERNKHRVVVYYDQTINRFTLLDIYILLRINQSVVKIPHYSVYVIDLRYLSSNIYEE